MVKTLSTWLLLSCSFALSYSRLATADSLIPNWNLQPGTSRATAPQDFQLSGDNVYENHATKSERTGYCVKFCSGRDLNQDQKIAAEMQTTVTNLSPADGRWFRLQIRGMADPTFAVEKEDLYLKVEFAKDGGKSTLDEIKQRFYAQVERERADLKDKGTNKKLGSATWRTYALDFRTPFPEVDTVKLTTGFAHGTGKGADAEFWIKEFELFPIPAPKEYVERTSPKTLPAVKVLLVPLGGRWYFDPQGGSKQIPEQFDHRNAEQLLYLSDGFIAPFAQNTTSWLRSGYLNAVGKLVTKDQYVEDNVLISVTKEHLVIRSRNLPNHPTALFPDRWRALDGNPNYIAEKQTTWHLPLEPKENHDRIAMKNETNTNDALPRGPIGVAVNGIVFFNPFDHLKDEDAVWRLDRCCGHPSPNSMYHYHKYPVCVKSPWTDNGENHSPVIGFAFDGFPVYGPYEAAHELAKDSQSNSLNEFNVHHDELRGWHYHVTPGKFPHIIGGYWGVTESRNRPPRGRARRGPPR